MRKFFKSRTFWKTASWSLIAFSVTAVIGWMLTGDWTKAGWIACYCRAVKVVAYVYHERFYRKWWPAHFDANASKYVPMVHEDYELESRRTLYLQTPAQHCNAG